MKMFSLLLSFLCTGMIAKGQTDTVKPVKIAVFTPVYLDSVFNGTDAASNNIPRYVLAGLDFYHGVSAAIDSLKAEKAPIEVYIYDSKSREAALSQPGRNPELAAMSLIIASFNTRNEVKPLADFALTNRIPLVSATYPNDAGVTGNPYFIMLNPRITTHIEGVFKYLQRNYPTDKIVLFRKRGSMEDVIYSMINDMNKKTLGTQLQFKTVLITDTTSTAQITKHLDSTMQNIVLCGSLNETFAMNLTRGIADAQIPATIIGMPTWDGVSGIGKGVDIVYSTPYNLTRTGQLIQHLDTQYRAKYALRPTDMYFKGFESMYHFSKLLLTHGADFMNQLSAKEHILFNEFNIRPVITSAARTTTDLLENQQLYFIRKIDNKLQGVQ